MSQLKTNAIRHTTATSDAITLASDGTATAKITNNASYRNLFINGSMRFAQRKTTSTAQEYALDRWKVTMNNTGVTNTHSQHTLTSADSGPWEAGHRNSIRVELSGAGTVSADTGLTILSSIEAQDVAHSGWDYTSASSYITFGFWFKASTNQTFYAYFESQDGTKQRYPFSFTASGNDTWTKITKTIPGNSNLQFDDNNGAGLRIYIEIFSGTNNTASGVSLDTWAASGSENIPDMASTWLTAGSGSTIEFTGIQLTATDFCPDYPHTTYGQELARCQRYFQHHFSSTNEGQTFATRFTTQAQGGITYYTALRAAPTATLKGINIHVMNTGANVDVTSMNMTISGTNYTTQTSLVALITAGSLVQGDACLAHGNAGDSPMGLFLDSDF